MGTYRAIGGQYDTPSFRFGCYSALLVKHHLPRAKVILMVGYITKRVIFRHPVLIYRIVGLRGVWRMLFARGNVTFFSLLQRGA